MVKNKQKKPVLKFSAHALARTHSGAELGKGLGRKWKVGSLRQSPEQTRGGRAVKQWFLPWLLWLSGLSTSL